MFAEPIDELAIASKCPCWKCIWLPFFKKWKVCNGFGVRPVVFPYQVWDNTLSACPWTWRERIGWHTFQTYHVKWEKASYAPVLSLWTFFFNWPAVATALSNALPSLYPWSVSLILFPPSKQENFSKTHGHVNMPAWC